jgi:hypothetical protein
MANAKGSKLPGAAKSAASADAAVAGGSKDEVSNAGVDLSHYDVATRKQARALIAAGKVLNGTEEADYINTMFEALQAEEREDNGDAEEVEGVPNMLPVRYEVFQQNGKEVKFPIFFVAAVKGGQSLYNERGQRVSPVCTQDSDPNLSYINKAAARNNAQRRANRLPGDAVAA